MYLILNDLAEFEYSNQIGQGVSVCVKHMFKPMKYSEFESWVCYSVFTSVY